VSWGEAYNAKDYDTVFINLLGLDQLVKDKTIVEVDDAKGANLPDSGDVAQLLETGGDVIATLPTRKTLTHSAGSYRKRSFRLLEWIPTEVYLTKEKGSSVDTSSIDERWQWYFTNNFQWDVLISAKGSANGSGNRCESRPLIKNRYDEPLAAELTFSRTNSNGSTDTTDWPGSVYLVPLLDDWSYEDFCENVLNRVLSGDIDPEDETKPPWVTDFEFPGEETQQTRVDRIQSEIQVLEQELTDAQEDLEDIQQFKQLLFESGPPLTKTVHRSLRRLGFEVDGERPHRRDGAIMFDDTTMVLAIHGTTGEIPQSKCEQLDTWVSDSQRHDPTGNYEGLFIVAPFRKDSPETRETYLDPDTEAYMDNRGHKILTTDSLYSLLVEHEQEEVTTDEITEMLRTDETVVDLGPSRTEEITLSK